MPLTTQYNRKYGLVKKLCAPAVSYINCEALVAPKNSGSL
jgi:hypothetical protein